MTEKTVMVVEDDEGMAELMKEILSVHHYHVLLAHDGLEAIEQTHHHHIDLILMDIRMPFFSGFWFCHAFHKKKSTRNIPIVMVSALLDEECVQKARLAGAADTVRKPFTSEELLHAVEKNAL